MVLRKLCAASCLDTTTEVIADKEVTFHEELIDGLSADWESDAGAEVTRSGGSCASFVTMEFLAQRSWATPSDTIQNAEKSILTDPGAESRVLEFSFTGTECLWLKFPVPRPYARLKTIRNALNILGQH